MSVIKNKAAHYWRENKIKAVSLITVLALLLISELGLRIYNKDFSWTHYPTFRQTYLLRNEYIRPDSELGWTLPYNRLVNQDISTDENGLRKNNLSKDGDKPSILIVGGSNILGPWFSSDKTIAAHLERKLDRRVGNAGVFDYGIDQAVLNAERLAAKTNPNTIILAMDEYSWNVSNYRLLHGLVRPDYRLDLNGNLIQRDAEAVGSYDPKPSLVARLFGNSLVADAIFSNIMPARWTSGFQSSLFFDPAIKSCAFLRRFLSLSNVDRKIVLLMPVKQALNDKTAAAGRLRFQQIIKICLTSNNTQIIDVNQNINNDPAEIERIFSGPGGLSTEGYALIADAIYKQMNRQ